MTHASHTVLCAGAIILGTIITAGFGVSMGAILYEVFNTYDYLWWLMLAVSIIILAINFTSIIFIVNIWRGAVCASCDNLRFNV